MPFFLMRRFFVVTGVWFLAVLASYLFLDHPLALFLHQYVSVIWLYRLAKLVSYAGLGGLVIAVIVSVFLFYRFVCYRPEGVLGSFYCFTCVAISGVLCDVMKPILGRARPLLWLDQGVDGFHFLSTKSHYFSFPSGHAVTVSAWAFALSFFLPRIKPYCLMIIVLVAMARLLLAAHYLSDVLVGAYLGALTAFVGYRYFYSVGGGQSRCS